MYWNMCAFELLHINTCVELFGKYWQSGCLKRKYVWGNGNNIITNKKLIPAFWSQLGSLEWGVLANENDPQQIGSKIK